MSPRNVSSDGVPNRKGGSWPNHPSMRYELPLPFSPGADNVTDAYRDGWDRIFGSKSEPAPEPPLPESPATTEPAGPGHYHIDSESMCFCLPERAGDEGGR